jgi:hypothetical protein
VTKKNKALGLLTREKIDIDGVFGLDLTRNSKYNPFFNFNNTVIMM